jgi:ribosomal protein L7/L12
MKLTRTQLAKLIGFIERNYAVNMSENQIEDIDDIIDVEVPQPEVVRPSNDAVERLMMFMAGGTNKIDAIREHRAITGMGLKESKEAVERYWPDGSKKLLSVADLRSKLNTTTWNITEYSIIENFIKSL